jgi:hypothetical protein
MIFNAFTILNIIISINEILEVSRKEIELVLQINV